MKNLVLAGAIAAAFAGSVAHADDVKPDNDVSFNAAVVSDYRYRGISQTRLQPALQGGADYVNNPTGLYAGTWLSSLKFIEDNGGDGNVEWDIYGGKRGQITDAISYDIGLLRYLYPSNELTPNIDTTEAYAQIGYGPAYFKYSRSLTNLFGFGDSKGSDYYDAGMNLDVGDGYILNLHAGYQKVAGNSLGDSNDRFSYTDWKIGVTRDFGIVTGSLAYIGTDADEDFYSSPANGKFLGKDTLVLSISKTF